MNRAQGIPARKRLAAEQLALLASGDVMRAYSLNSRANKERWCGAERFEQVLRGHADFRQLLVEGNGVAVGACHVSGNMATVQVSLPRKESATAVSLVWTMVTEIQPATAASPGSEASASARLAWRTEKVMRVDET